jgi:hypothetical protein
MDFYLQHFEFANVIPAFILGYIISRKFPEFGSWGWLLPTAVISYKLLTFSDPNVSVLAASNPWRRFSYYFVIEPRMPTLYDLRGSDFHRVLEQVTVVAAFYSSIAYSIGAFAMKTKVLQRILERLSREPEPEVIGPEEAGVLVIADDSMEDPLHEK